MSNLVKINFTAEVPEDLVVDLENRFIKYLKIAGGKYLDYHIFYDDSWLKDNDPHYRKLISERARMSKHINDYRNRCDH